MSRAFATTPGARVATAPTEPSVAEWRARFDALTRWCLSDLPLAGAAADAVPLSRPTLGDLLRRALAHDGAGVVDLLDALDAPETPSAGALLGRVLGADLLLVVVTARDGAMVRADARACRSAAEARALVNAFLGAPAPDSAATCGIAAAGGVVGPALACGTDGRCHEVGIATATRHDGDGSALTIVLPFLALDDPRDEPRDERPAEAPPLPVAAAAPEPLVIPAILGGTLRPGAAFLDADFAGIAVDDGTADEAADDTSDDATAYHDAAPDLARESPNDGERPAADDHDDLADPAGGARTTRGATPGRAPFASGLAAAAAGTARPAAVVDDGPDDVTPHVDMTGALDRLRARTAAAVERVSVLIATDDGVAEHVADAAAWLAEASEQELRALARGGWSGDAAVEIAHALAEDDPEALEVVQLARRHETELVVEVDGDAAAAWLAAHRPDVAERLAPQLR